MEAALKDKGKKLTCILSIDGGGIRGIIPATILLFLEEELQKLDGPNVRIADYFDVVAGTSTGGIIAGILTTPDEKGRPKFDAMDVKNFYLEKGPSIFAERGLLPAPQLVGPKHEATSLENSLHENLKGLKMKDTLCELIIPTFDMGLMQPIYFSTSEAQTNESKNAYVQDVLRGTSAAPTYFSPHVFDVTTADGGSRTFNLIDGGIGINNPTHLSIAHTIRFQSKVDGYRAINVEDYKNLLVLSLGTGKVTKSYNAQDAATWGLLSWVVKDGKSPLLDIVSECSADVVEYNLSVFFSVLKCTQNYLRIQDYNIAKDIQPMDDASSENMERLSEVGEKLLDSPVSILDMERGVPQILEDQGTNGDALKRFAQRLSIEYNTRKAL